MPFAHRRFSNVTNVLTRLGLSRKLLAGIAAVVAFVAALVTLWVPIHHWLWPHELNVYVLHPHSQDEDGVWREFDRGLDRFLTNQGASLDSQPLKVGEYELSFRSRTWTDEDGLREQVEGILADRRALAVIAATNSQQSEILLEAMPEDERPLVLLATATKGDLVRHKDVTGISRPARKVCRLVAPNEKQAWRLASTIVTPSTARCSTGTETVGVAILREEHENSSFSRDLAKELANILEEAQKVDVLVRASVDPGHVVPKELVELSPDYLVYIGPQRNAVTVYNQIRHHRSTNGQRDCLPTLLLTDAGVIENGESSYKGMVEPSYVTLPFTGEHTSGENTSEEQGGFHNLGWDSGALIFEAARAVVQQAAHGLKTDTLTRELVNLDLEGEALSYEFKDGENVRADFHLWEASDGRWRHRADCKSDKHSAVPQLAGFFDEPQHTSRASTSGEDTTLLIGAKPFTEQRILAELAILALNDAGIRARRGIESLNGIRDALLLNKIDGYWEYTGTALRRHHKQQGAAGQAALEQLRRLDEGEITWMSALPVDNTYVLAARKSFSREYDISTIGDLAQLVKGGGEARLCSNAEWFEIRDGLVGLEQEYDFSWPKALLHSVPRAVLYEKFAQECDVMVVFATDARLRDMPVEILQDDQAFFPEYRPAFVLRQDIHQKIAGKSGNPLGVLRRNLKCLESHLDNEAMRRLNSQVEMERADPAAVARAFFGSHCARPDPSQPRV